MGLRPGKAMKRPYSTLHIIVLFFMSMAVATAQRTPFYADVPTSGRLVDRVARTSFEEVWTMAKSDWEARRYEKSQALWRDAKSQARALYGKNHPITREAAAWVKRATTACTWNEEQNRDFEELEGTIRRLHEGEVEKSAVVQVLQQLLKSSERLFGPKSLDCAIHCQRLGYRYLELGHLNKARQVLERASSLFAVELGPGHAAFAVSAQDNMKVCRLLGDLERAHEWIWLAKAAWLRADVPDNGNAVLGLGLKEAACWRDAGEFNRMRGVLSRQADWVEERFGKKNELYARVCLRAARLQSSEPGRADAANVWLDEADFSLKDLADKNASLFAQRDSIAARVALRNGDIKQAHALAERARKSYQKLSDQKKLKAADLVDVFSVWMEDIETIAIDGKRDEALDEMLFMLDGLEKVKSKLSLYEYEELRYQAIHTFRIMGEHQRAAKLATEVLVEWEGRVGKDAFRRARILRELGRVFQAQRRFQDSEKCFVEALAIEAKALGNDSAGQIWTLNAFAEMLRDWGKEDRAAEIEKRIAKFDFTFEPPTIPKSANQGGGSFSN